MKEKQESKKEKEVDPNLEKIAQLEKDLAEWKDKAYRTIADCDNLRKSYEKDHHMMVKYRGQPFVEKLLPTLDSFYLVLSNVPEEPMLKNYLLGFQMIYKNMIEALKDEGVEEIIPQLNCEFDHKTMQAIDTAEGEVDNLVLKVSKPGYMLRDRLVRPAMVVVSKKKVEKPLKEEPKEEKEEKVEETLEEKGE